MLLQPNFYIYVFTSHSITSKTKFFGSPLIAWDVSWKHQNKLILDDTVKLGKVANTDWSCKTKQGDFFKSQVFYNFYPLYIASTMLKYSVFLVNISVMLIVFCFVEEVFCNFSLVWQCQPVWQYNDLEWLVQTWDWAIFSIFLGFSNIFNIFSIFFTL